MFLSLLFVESPIAFQEKRLLASFFLFQHFHSYLRLCTMDLWPTYWKTCLYNPKKLILGVGIMIEISRTFRKLDYLQIIIGYNNFVGGIIMLREFSYHLGCKFSRGICDAMPWSMSSKKRRSFETEFFGWGWRHRSLTSRYFIKKWNENMIEDTSSSIFVCKCYYRKRKL